MIRLADNRSENFISWFCVRCREERKTWEALEQTSFPTANSYPFSTRLPRQSIYTNNMLCVCLSCISRCGKRDTRTFNRSVLHNSFLIVFIRIKGSFIIRLRNCFASISKMPMRQLFCLFSPLIAFVASESLEWKRSSCCAAMECYDSWLCCGEKSSWRKQFIS